MTLVELVQNCFLFLGGGREGGIFTFSKNMLSLSQNTACFAHFFSLWVYGVTLNHVKLAWICLIIDVQIYREFCGGDARYKIFLCNPQEVQIWAWLRSISNPKRYHLKAHMQTTFQLI